MPEETRPFASHLNCIFPSTTEMARLMRALDWAKIPLSPAENWPESLKITVGLSGVPCSSE